MKNARHEIIISGIGITSSIGQGKQNFFSNLISGNTRFDVMQRQGRQVQSKDFATRFIGAEIDKVDINDEILQTFARRMTFSGQVMMATIEEAWRDANLDNVDPARIGLIIGGSNFQQRDSMLIREKFQEKPFFINPSYGMMFMDSDICGICTEYFGIKGLAHTVGGASASGQLAAITAANLVKSGEVDICIAVGSMMDLSYWELLALQSLGAMVADDAFELPINASRPFDKNTAGFAYGESCGAVVIEKADNHKRESTKNYAHIIGMGVVMDANSNPDSSPQGEMRVIEKALVQAQINPSEIDYVNPHGSGSRLGDKVELQALNAVGLHHSKLNTTKSIVGHGLTSAGIVELVATVLQGSFRKLHPCLNLHNPIDDGFNWVINEEDFHINYALNLSHGFGGINTAICLSCNV
jgi:malonyl-ACP decarboxylase